MERIRGRQGNIIIFCGLLQTSVSEKVGGALLTKTLLKLLMKECQGGC